MVSGVLFCAMSESTLPILASFGVLAPGGALLCQWHFHLTFAL